MAGYEKLVVVTRRTRLEELIDRFNTKGQAKFYIEHSGGSFSDYEREDDAYRRSLDRVRRSLELGLKLQSAERALGNWQSKAVFASYLLLASKALVKYVGDLLS